MRHLLLGSLLLALGCTRERSRLQTALLRPPSTDEDLRQLYYQADTVLERPDSLLIVNTRRDTVLVETGIFTYLQYGYPLAMPYAPIALTRQALAAARAHDAAGATRRYQDVADYFEQQWLTRRAGTECGGYSDLNDYYAGNVNVRLLASYAYEQLGRLPEARAALAGFLANSEAERSRIRLRYVELCVRQFGREATRQALAAGGRTVRHHAAPNAPERDYWCVTVFGAPLGIAAFGQDTLTPRAAQRLLEQQPYYALVR